MSNVCLEIPTIYCIQGQSNVKIIVDCKIICTEEMKESTLADPHGVPAL